ncbi:ribonuclease H-like domain-containing protein, partial [Tanacetum coccineum]
MAPNDPSGSTVLINNLDTGNPLHIQTNDNSSTTLIPFEFLGIKNYRIWSSAMKLALQARNKYSFVDELESTYDKVDGPVIFNLLQKSNYVKQGGTSVADYYHRLNSLWREFDALTKLPKCVCEPLRSTLLTRDPLPEVKDAYTIVSREESHKGILETSNATELKMSDTSFAAKSINNSRRFFNNNNNGTRGSNNNMNRGPNANLQNFNANIDVKNNDKQSSASVSSIGFTFEQMQKLLSLINDNSTRSVHANMTDANQHLTVSTVGMFNVIDITSLKITIGHPNGTLDTISHVRNMKLSNNVVLYDVLVFFGYCVSL